MAQTLVTFHAHPGRRRDRAAAGTMAQAKADGHRVVLVIATRGELGETPRRQRRGGSRRSPTRASRRRPPVPRSSASTAWSSSATSTPAWPASRRTTAPGSFAAADVEEAAERLARILDEEHADVLTVYDDHGGTAIPTTSRCTGSACAPAEIAGTPTGLRSDHEPRSHPERLMGEQPDALESVEAEDRPTTDEIATTRQSRGT